MTYIKRERRVALDPIIDGLVKRLRSIDADRYDVAYTVTRVAMEALRPQVRWTRQALSDCADALYAAAEEIETRMVQPYTEADIQLNGDLECFQDGLAVLVPLPPGEMRAGEMEKFNVIGTQTGRWKGGQENPCVEVTNSLATETDGIHPPFNADYTRRTKIDINPCVEVTNSLAPGMALSDLFACGAGELKPVSEALSDDQIEAAEKQRQPFRQIEVTIKVNEDRKGVTLTRDATGHSILIPNDMGLGGKLDVARDTLLGSHFVHVWSLSISLEKWDQICSRTMPSNYEEDHNSVQDTE